MWDAGCRFWLVRIPFSLALCVTGPRAAIKNRPQGPVQLRQSYEPCLFKIGVSGTHFFFSDSLLMDDVRDRGF